MLMDFFKFFYGFLEGFYCEAFSSSASEVMNLQPYDIIMMCKKFVLVLFMAKGTNKRYR